MTVTKLTHYVKRGDTPRLRWALDRDLTGVTLVKVLVRAVTGTAALELATGAEVDNAVTGIVAQRIVALDWGSGKFETDLAVCHVYFVEIETTHPDSGVLTHPSSYLDQYARIIVLEDLG